ncbi:MAG TPA: type II secretion system protein [Planctomycetota bacterium]|nr:type II secretion system protein [Planctomycetota bacterium]
MLSSFRAKRLAGFTLLEILIVMSIILILVAASFAVYAGILNRRRKALAVLQVSQIEEAARQYFEQFQCYPPDTGDYESDDMPPSGMSSSQLKYSIMRYLGMQIMDQKTGLTYGPYLRDLNNVNVTGEPTDVDGMKVQLYVDPWGNPYQMDCMHSTRDKTTRNVTISKPYADSVPLEQRTLEVKVWSNGPDGKASDKPSFYPDVKQPEDEDNIMSWAKGSKL